MVKAVKRFLALFLTAVMAVTFFPQFSEIISVTAYAEEQLWDKTYDKNGCSVITIDKKVYYGNSGYSIKIKNKNYNAADVKRRLT